MKEYNENFSQFWRAVNILDQYVGSAKGACRRQSYDEAKGALIRLISKASEALKHYNAWYNETGKESHGKEH
jgi:hypothetical protein